MLLIVGYTRRSRAERVFARASTPTWTPVAAWYPDPGGEHVYRYWDGERWTDFTAG